MSNFENAARRQQRPGLAKLLGALSQSLHIQAVNSARQGAPAQDRAEALGALQSQVKEQLSNDYKRGTETATALGERGALRALLWGQKVSMVQNALTGRFLRSGEALLKDTQVHVCEACGFVIVKGDVPDVCPICKAPSDRFVSL
jgi:rubrerythrin